MNIDHVARTDLNLLVVLDDLLRSRSTTVTARRLGRTQSAVSHALRRLRLLFDDPLFVRAGATLRPTSAAERMRAPLRDVMVRAEGVLSRTSIDFDPSRIEQTFTIAGTDYSEILVMPRLLSLVRRRAPGVNIVTRPLGDDVERAIQTREVDLTLGTGFRLISGVAVENIFEDELVVLLRRGHPALQKKLTPRRYAELDHVLVSPRGQPGGIIDSALEPLGLSRRVVLRMPYFGAATIVVAQSDLAVTLPAKLVDVVSKGFGVVSVPVPFSLSGFSFSMAYSTTFKDDPAHRWFRELAVEAARH